MKIEWAFVAILLVIGVWCLLMQTSKTREGISGFGVTSGLAYNNRMAYCWPGTNSNSGGCTIPHRVIV